MLLVVVVSAFSLLLQLPYSGEAFIVGSSSVAYHRRQGIRTCRHGPLHLADLGAAVASNDKLRDETTEPTNNNDGLGLLRGVDVTADKFYANEIDMSETGLAWLDQPGLMWEAAVKDAAEKKIPVEEYMQQVNANLETFALSDIIYDRKELLEELNKAFTYKGGFTLLLGGKNVGKSKILESRAQAANKNSESNLLVLYVDARLCPGHLDAGLANELARLAFEKLMGKPDVTDWLEVVEGFAHLGRDAAIDAAIRFVLPASGQETNEKKDGMENALRKVFLMAFDKLLFNPKFDAKVSKSLLEQFIKISGDGGKFPVLIIDEANEVLGNKDNDSETRKFLTNLVSFTKQKGRMNVILSSSEHSYPYRLQREGFNLRNIGNLIFAGEIPPKEMWKLLVSAMYEEGDNKGRTIIGMGPHLAELCLAAYGGHFLDVRHAIQGLESKQNEAEVSVYLPNLSPEIIACLNTNTKAQPLLEAMAKYGFAPIEAPDNPVAELISEKNVGGVLTKNGACIDISTTQWQGTEDEFALVPSSQCVRLRIARVLRTHNSRLLSPARFFLAVLKQIRKALGLGKP